VRRGFLLVGGLGGLILVGGMLFPGRAPVIAEITVEGGERIGTSQIRATSGLHVGQVWNSSVQEHAVQALSRLPQVRRVALTVERRVADHVDLRLRVEERQPYGIVSLTDRGLYWIDREGYLVESLEGKPFLPVVSGLRTEATPTGERITSETGRRVIEEFFALDGRLLSRFTELHVREYDLVLRAREGWRVLLPAGALHSITHMDAVLSALGDRSWRTMDLRVEGAVTLTP
jgi:hypothetical protein